MWKFALPRVVMPHIRRTYTTGHAGGSARHRATAGAVVASHRSILLRRMLYTRHTSFLFAMATLMSLLHQRPLMTLAEAAVAVKKDVVEPDQPQQKQSSFAGECYFYGCPLWPQDVFYNTAVREALTAIRPRTRQETMSRSDDLEIQDAMAVLEPCGNQDMATLTLIGYKGGPPDQQVNQDRALVMTSFRLGQEEKSENLDPVCDAEGMTNRLLGVFDGHARLGEGVSQYAVSELPKLLSRKLDKSGVVKDDDSSKEKDDAVKQILVDSFVELDKTAPAQVSGGCTASVILQLGSDVYVANAGDSRSFIVAYCTSTQTVEIVYASREDKPDLADERARVEAMGGKVYIPFRTGATSRVLYTDPNTGHQSGLAMSRSIGDWEVGKLGVIPDPIVEVIHIPELVQARMRRSDDGATPTQQPLDDVQVFAVSATDGLLDYVAVETIAKILAQSLFDADGEHPLSACERLISKAATGWQTAKQGRYRDDIAIAVSKIRTAPPQ